MEHRVYHSYGFVLVMGHFLEDEIHFNVVDPSKILIDDSSSQHRYPILGAPEICIMLFDASSSRWRYARRAGVYF